MNFEAIQTALSDLDFLDVNQTYLSWLLATMTMVLWLRLQFLAHRVEELEHKNTNQTSESGWIIPTPEHLDNPSFKIRRHMTYADECYPVTAIREIRPWDNRHIAALSLFVQRAVRLNEIAVQRRILTVSAVVYQFAVPQHLLLIDEGSILLYREYRRLNKMIVADAHRIELEHEVVPTQRMLFVAEYAHKVFEALLVYLPNDNCPHAQLLRNEIVIPGGETWLTAHEVRSVITAYSAYASIAVPTDYVVYDDLAYVVYLKLLGQIHQFEITELA